MIKIGHVDLGSSHPPKFIEMEKELGYVPYGLYDDFRLKDKEYMEKLADMHSMKPFSSLEEMADEVDVAFIHSVNWDIHLERIIPFIKRGKGVYIDKPVCGCLEHIKKIESLVENGARISGGSMILFNDEIISLQKDKDLINDAHIIFAGGPKDVFYYGIHVFYMVSGVFGFDIEQVKYLGTSTQKIYEITWKNRKKSIIAIGGVEKYFPFHMTLVSSIGVRQYNIKGFLSLKNMLEKVIPYIAGQDVDVPNIKLMLNCERAALAALISERRGGKPVFLSDIDDKTSYDGALYEKSYGGD